MKDIELHFCNAELSEYHPIFGLIGIEGYYGFLKRTANICTLTQLFADALISTEPHHIIHIVYPYVISNANRGSRSDVNEDVTIDELNSASVV
ncbi:hypothetical protein Trydic_g19060 [Trypoxylus dichotomus]